MLQGTRSIKPDAVTRMGEMPVVDVTAASKRVVQSDSSGRYGLVGHHSAPDK